MWFLQARCGLLFAILNHNHHHQDAIGRSSLYALYECACPGLNVNSTRIGRMSSQERVRSSMLIRVHVTLWPFISKTLALPTKSCFKQCNIDVASGRKLQPKGEALASALTLPQHNPQGLVQTCSTPAFTPSTLHGAAGKSEPDKSAK